MPASLLQCLFELAMDPLRAARFRNNPESDPSFAELTSADRAVLLSGDPAAIRAALVEPPPDRDLTLLAWIAALAEENAGDA